MKLIKHLNYLQIIKNYSDFKDIKMSEHIVETTTIISENGKTIIIAHPPVKK